MCIVFKFTNYNNIGINMIVSVKTKLAQGKVVAFRSGIIFRFLFSLLG